MSAGGTVIYVESAAGDANPKFSAVKKNLEEAGFAGEVLNFGWVTGFGVLVDHLMPPELKHEHAARLAELIQQRSLEYPGEPVDLITYSAGSAILLYAVEQLPYGQVRNIVLFSPSISDTFDLSVAAARISGRIVVTSSPMDYTLMLASLVGTTDGVSCGFCAMGLNGPRSPLHVDTELSRVGRVCELRWTPELAELGHTGFHAGPFGHEFVQQYIIPLLLADSQ